MRLIVSGDQHLRIDLPLCRTESEEDWKKFQRDRLDEVVIIANQYKSDIAFTGDTLDVPRVPSEIVSMLILALQNLNGIAHFISGNHEKQYRREANVETSSIGIIKALAGDNTGKIRYYVSDENIAGNRFEHSYRLNDEITLIHTLSFPSEDDVPFGCEAATPEELFAKYDTKYLFVGDCHLAFHVEQKGRHIVSSGCMDVQTVKEMEYEPSVYFVDTDKDIVERIKLFHDPALCTKQHIVAKHERDASMEEALKAFEEVGEMGSLDYKKNLELYLQEHKVSSSIHDIIDEAGGENE